MSLNPYESPKSLSAADREKGPQSATSGLWFKIRLGVYALGLVSGVPTAHQEVSELAKFEPWGLAFLAIPCGVATLLMPLMLLFVISIQAVNPWSDEKWLRPTHGCNPFRLGNPLLFFHFGAYWFGAIGIGFLLSALWNGVYAVALGVFMLLGAVATLAGVRLSMLVFKSKMADER